jgi:hypothetical protein
VRALFVVGRREEVMVSVCANLGERLLVVLLIFLVARVRYSFMRDERLVMVLGFEQSGFTLFVAHKFEFYNDKY